MLLLGIIRWKSRFVKHYDVHLPTFFIRSDITQLPDLPPKVKIIMKGKVLNHLGYKGNYKRTAKDTHKKRLKKKKKDFHDYFRKWQKQ